jgi:FkbM family methyltransferase
MIEQIVSRDGHVYWIEQGDTLYRERLQEGQYQKTNWLFSQTLIDQWHRAIDVGSNNGCNSIHYAQRFDHVECFEPTPLAQVLWQQTIKDNGVVNAQLYAMALGSCADTREMLSYPRNGGHNHIRATDRVTKKHMFNTDVVALDSLSFDQVGYIKIDVEGFELPVLQGAVETIDQWRPTIQLELVANQCRRFGYLAEDLIEFMRARDYTVVSKLRGNLYGQFQSQKVLLPYGQRWRLLYDGEYHRGEMDLWLQPNERVRHSHLSRLFEIEHG